MTHLKVQLIPQAGISLNGGFSGGGGGEFFTQTGDVDVDGVCGNVVAFVPDVVNDVFAGGDTAGI